MKALIFGANGQDGFYLSQLLQKAGIRVIPISRKNADVIGDVGNKDFVFKIIQEEQPQFVFHLAANSTTAPDAWEENHHTICNGSLYLLEACRQWSPHTKVFLSGSALQFQNIGLPINEDTPFEASSPYAVSRIHSVYAARYYRSMGLKVYVGYFFNHDSPRRSERHMAMRIAAYAQRTKAALPTEKLIIGDLGVAKEWTFAGDTVQAIWALVQQETIWECCIGSGTAHTIAEWVALCFGLAGTDPELFVKVDTAFKAPFQTLVSDNRLLLSLGWQPQVSLEELAQMMMCHAR